MFGFIIGTVCLIGLIKVLRHGHGWHGRWHGDFGYGGGRATRGFGPRWFVRSVFERLDTTPGQEKAILSALDELRENKREVYEEMKQTRADFARAVSSGLVDDATLEETFARHDRLLARLRVSFVEALKKITETLDERQRKQVADVLESGGLWGGGRHWGGPYRGGSAWA